MYLNILCIHFILTSKDARCTEIHDSETYSESSEASTSTCSDLQGPEEQNCFIQPQLENTNTLGDYKRSWLRSKIPEKPDDSLLVTVLQCLSTLPGGEKTELYYFIAGSISKEDRSQYEGQGAVTVTAFSDKLHNQIRDQCETDLLSKLSGIKRRNVEAESPLYIVTEQMPALDTSQINFASIKPTIEKGKNRLSFKYIHSRNPNLFVEVFEPASPSEVIIHLSEDNVLSATLKKQLDKEKVCLRHA